MSSLTTNLIVLPSNSTSNPTNSLGFQLTLTPTTTAPGPPDGITVTVTAQSPLALSLLQISGPFVLVGTSSSALVFQESPFNTPLTSTATLAFGVSAIGSTVTSGFITVVVLWFDADGPHSEILQIGPSFQATSISKTAQSSVVSPGANITYTIVATNRLSTPEPNLTITDALPAGTTFVSANTTLGTLTTPPVGTNGTVTLTIPSLAAGQSATLTLVAATGSSMTGAVSNSASLSSLAIPTLPGVSTATVQISTGLQQFSLFTMQPGQQHHPHRCGAALGFGLGQTGTPLLPFQPMFAGRAQPQTKIKHRNHKKTHRHCSKSS